MRLRKRGYGAYISLGGTPGAYYGALVVKAEVSNSNNGFSVVADGTSVYSIDYQGTAGFENAILNPEPDDDSNYTTTTEEYRDWTIQSVPVKVVSAQLT